MPANDLEYPCPMCGEPVLPDADACPACGERLKDKPPPVLHASDRFLLKEFQTEMIGLAVIWYVVGGLITAAMASVWIAALLENNLPGLYWMDDGYLGSAIDALLTVFGVIFLIIGSACRRRQEWGLYASLINGYCALAMNLLAFQLFFNLCGIALVIPVLLLAHIACRTARRLKQAGVPLDFQF